MKFTELDLHPKIQENLLEIGFADCTPIQEQAIPHLLNGKDLAGLAQTGTGKTAAFLLPLLDRILRSMETPPGARGFPDWKKRNCLLVLVPTRELADQVYENACRLIPGTNLSAVAIYGGTTYEKQKAALSEGVEIVIATPGRLIDLYKEHCFDMGQVRAVVFDEADRMFDMGFKDDMRFILRRIPRERQFLVFSATLNFDVLNVAYEFGADPVEINISRDQAKAEHVKDMIFHVGQEEKAAYLLSLFKRESPKQSIIFSNFKHNVERIAQFLNKNGLPAMGISSLLTQQQRNRVMAQFRAENDRNILIATDLAARGLDILGVDMVVNFELPEDPENYVHRIGRTGRAGQEGRAFSLVSDRDVESLSRIEAFMKNKIEAGWMDDAQIIKDFAPFPRDEGRRSSMGPRRPERGGDRPQGDRDRGPRRERSGPPRGDGPRRHDGPPPRHAQGERQDRPARHASGDAAPTGAHRDRRTGRHEGARHDKQGGSQEPRAHSGQGGQGHRRHGQGQGQAQGGHGGPRRHSGNGADKRQHGHGKAVSRPHTPRKPDGIGKKVSGLIKRLFGSKPPAKSSTRKT